MDWVPFILAAAMSIIHYFSGELSEKVEKFHDEIIGFSAGLFITLLFVFFLPEFFKGREVLGETIFALMLGGFVFFHVSEKYIYQHVKNRKELMKDLAEVHAVGFFVDHFVVGMALVFAFQQGISALLGFAVFIPLLLHTLASSISLSHIDEYFNKSTALNIVLSVSPLLGVFFAAFLNPDRALYYAVFSAVVGALFYIVVRDMLPEKKEGRLAYFLLGFAASLIMVYGIKLLV
ncbi:MAG TPA: hypothetical protein VFF09_00280 [archaeon]|nr:hypothetical protein [archaeon]